MTAIGAVLVEDKKVVNIIVVDTSDGVTVNGFNPKEGVSVYILPFGSEVSIGWDYINNQFYKPLPTEITLNRDSSIEVPYQMTGTYLDGVSLVGQMLTASADAELGDFTLTLADPNTGRTSECIVSIKEAPSAE